MEALQPFLMPGLILITFIVAFIFWKKDYAAGGSSSTQIAGLIESAALAKNNSDWQQASMLYSRALNLIDDMRTVDESRLSECLVQYSTVLERSGERQEAENQRKRLISIWNSALDRGDCDLMTEVDYLCANAEFGAQTIDVANYYERLLAVREKTHSPNSDVFINTVVIYSRLMRTLGEKEIADDLESHAQKLREGGSNDLNLNKEANLTSPGELDSPFEDTEEPQNSTDSSEA